jgi:hypothetical protein
MTAQVPTLEEGHACLSPLKSLSGGGFGTGEATPHPSETKQERRDVEKSVTLPEVGSLSPLDDL